MPSKRYTTIRVTDEDIMRATRNNSARCVLATAVARTFPGATRVSVDTQSLRFTYDGERHVYFTPPDAVGYVIAFDAGEVLHPFAFRLSENARMPPVPVHQSTPARKARERARNAQRKAQRQYAEAKASGDAKAIKDAANAVVAAVEERERVRAATKGQTTDPRPQPRREKVPHVFTRGERHYGHRALRINQPDAIETPGRANVLSAYNRWTD